MSERPTPIFAPDECRCHGGNPELHLRHGWASDEAPETGKPIALGPAEQRSEP